MVHSWSHLDSSGVEEEEDTCLLMSIGHKARSCDVPFVEHLRLSIETTLFDGHRLGSVLDGLRHDHLCSHPFSRLGFHHSYLRPSDDGEGPSEVHPTTHQMLSASGTEQVFVRVRLALFSAAIRVNI